MAMKRESVAPNKVDEHIGKRIMMRRIIMGMSQKELAKRIGVSFQQVQKYEAAENRISAARLFQIGIILDTPVSFFYSGLPNQIGIDRKMLHKVTEPGNNTENYSRDETFKLIQLYWKLSNDDVRKNVMELLENLSKTPKTPPSQS